MKLHVKSFFSATRPDGPRAACEACISWEPGRIEKSCKMIFNQKEKNNPKADTIIYLRHMTSCFLPVLNCGDGCALLNWNQWTHIFPVCHDDKGKWKFEQLAVSHR
jgi:hypothetical protein